MTDKTTDERWEHCGMLACAMRAQCVQPQDCKSGQQHQMTDEERVARDILEGRWRERPDYWDGYHQAMLGHPLKAEGGAEYKRGHAEGLEAFARKLQETP